MLYGTHHRILVDDISGTGPFMSVQLPNMFPQSVTLGTQETVAVLLNITDVAEVVIIQIQIDGLLVTRENVVPTELRCHQLLFLVSRRHTCSS